MARYIYDVAVTLSSALIIPRRTVDGKSTNSFFGLFRHARPALWTIPYTFRLFCNPHAVPMEPFVRTTVIVTCHHIPAADLLTDAVLFIIDVALISILNLHLIPRHRWHRR